MQVGFKRYNLFDKLKKKRLIEYLRAKPVPVVRGPNGKLFLIDHHHLSRALIELGHPVAFGFIVADLIDREPQDFWSTMDRCKWVYPLKPDGTPVDILANDLPNSVVDMTDDPFRSLAGFVRRAEGFSKVERPFVEFEWAKFFRDHLDKSISIDDMPSKYEKVLSEALKLAKSKQARDMPGYLGKTNQVLPTGTNFRQDNTSTLPGTHCAETGAGIPDFTPGEPDPDADNLF